MTEKDDRVYPASTSIHAKGNPVTRCYIPKEIVEWLGLDEKDTVGFMKDTFHGEHTARIKRLR